MTSTSGWLTRSVEGRFVKIAHSAIPVHQRLGWLGQLTLQVRALYVFRGAQVMRHFWVERVSYPCQRIPTRGHGGVLREI